MDVWEFDAPQFVDFTQPQRFENEYNDTWFDTHTEDDDFLGLRKEADATQTKPKRALRNMATWNKQSDNEKVEVVDTGCKSPRYLNGKPARVLIGEKHASQTSVKNDCPSPSKRQKKSTGDHNMATSSPPVANTRLQMLACSDNPEAKLSSDDSPSTLTRLRTPNKDDKSKSPNPQNSLRSPKAKLQTGESPKMTNTSEKTRSSRKTGKYNNTARNRVASVEKHIEKPTTLMRSQSLKCRRVPKPAETVLMSNKPQPEQKLVCINKEKPSDSDVNKNSVVKCKTTEELELEKIAAMKREMARTRKMAQESYKKAMSAQCYVPMRSAQPATLAVGFTFKTDERIKNPDIHTQDYKVKDFTESLREALPHQTLPTKPQIRGLTQPQPFKLTSAKSTNSLPQANKYESVAERVIAFHRKTPDRFKSQPHGSKERSNSESRTDNSSRGRHVKPQSPKMTIAKTPNLTTRGRHRPVHVLSREEKEQLEFEEHQKQQFKAQPVNQKIFDSPVIPKIAPKPTTTVEEFNLHSYKSASCTDLRASENTTDDEKYEFHANPVNPKILAGPVGITKVEPKPLTVAESPAFALKNRIRVPVEIPKKEEVKEPTKVGQVPYTGIPFKPRLPHHYTIPEPFSVEERSRAMLTRRDCKIQQILEDERKAHEFYANGLPSDSPDQLPPKNVKPVTQPEPFHLKADDRGEKYQRELRSKREEEERIAREIATFKAGPNNVIHKEPFQALKSSRPLTERSNFELNTDIRAVQREAFDQHLKSREAEMEALKRQRDEIREREEKAAISRLRLQTVHRANSVKRYTSVTVKPSDKPLTEAQSPRFSQRIRTKNTEI